MRTRVAVAGSCRRPGTTQAPADFGSCLRTPSCWWDWSISSDWRCRACRSYGRPFYSRAELRYPEQGTGPLAAELDRLWRAKGAMKGRPAREGAGDEADDWRALPHGADGLASPRRFARTVTDLYYPGLQDRPPGRDRPNDGRGP